MLPEKILEPGSLRQREGRVSVSVRMPWYRALPLSSVTDVSLEVDGVQVPTDSLRWTLQGRSYSLDELPPRHDQWWYVLDSVTVDGELPDLDPETPHEVHATVGLYIPYIVVGNGTLKIVEHDRKTMHLEEAGA